MGMAGTVMKQHALTLARLTRCRNPRRSMRWEAVWLRWAEPAGISAVADRAGGGLCDMRRPLILLAAFVGAAYTLVFKNLGHEILSNPYAGHVLLVPIVGGALFWSQRTELSRLTGRGGFLPIFLLAAAFLLLMAGYGTASVSVQVVSFIAALTGVLLWRYGTLAIRRIAFSLGFLLMMVPPPRDAVAVISPLMQKSIATVSGVMLGILGVPVTQRGVFLSLPGQTL